MSKEIFIELRSALYPPENIAISVNRGDERIQQVYSGIKAFLTHFNTIEAKENCEIFFVDNTVGSKKDLPKQISDILEENKIVHLLCDKNYYGSRNKGAGDIDLWRENFSLISDFKWFLHFEPRTILNSHEFIDQCITNPNNTFKILRPDNSPEHFYTGLFMMDTMNLKDYINSVDLDMMVNDYISIEYSLLEFMKSTNPDKFKDYTKQLKVSWHDAHENRLIEF
jgi:hypothetical protein